MAFTCESLTGSLAYGLEDDMSVKTDTFGSVRVTGKDAARLDRYVRDENQPNARSAQAVKRARELIADWDANGVRSLRVHVKVSDE
ncbi:hypothetical protein [Spiribacter sp. SSL99]|nr:hypothetical protein [Spiribacter sp. SSL99]